MILRSSGFLHAVLGPTNTGKTHYALSRMVGHETGMIGFPLRLLARENYDRLAQLKGEEAVALVTGEEKIIPPKARWFSCTVESMPLDRKVKFIAIDEIQLAGDPDRGHVFTDRLLHARGEEETLFLGAEIMRPLLRKLVPGITIETRPRLSSLAYTEPVPLNRLPPRTAIVAFSAPEVYALAETIRQKRGGCALIMGRLSPRTRNAQIELYQKGEVDYLVATDAIGMGLNMDVDHIALSSLRKFDGRQHRPLTLQEIAQIAGRAGRGMKDGTFGTITGSETLSPETITAIENHDFAPLKQIYWRESFLDFSTPRTLLKSLQSKPPHSELIKGREASDLAVLEYLAASEKIINATHNPKTTRILWEVCQIPDFKKLGDGSHAQLCEKLYFHLLKEGKIPTDWIEGQLQHLNHCEGSIDTLMQRLQGVRTCSYIATHQNWLTRSTYWQERSFDVENRLSDVLHERLTARFINKRAVTLLKRDFSGHKSDLFHNVTKNGHILIEGHDIGQIKGFTITLDNCVNKAEEILLMKTARRALQAEMPVLIQKFLSGKFLDLSFGDHDIISWNGASIGRLKRGEGYFTPKISLFPGEFQDTHNYKIAQTHLQKLISTQIESLLSPFHEAWNESVHDPVLRGLLHRLKEDGGLTDKLGSDRNLTALKRKKLRHFGINIGERTIYCAFLFKHPVSPMLLRLHSLWHNGKKDLPGPGMIKLGSLTLSVIRLEQALRHIRKMQKASHQVQAPANLAAMLGIRQSSVADILKLLKIPCLPPRPLASGIYGPAAPLMLKSLRLHPIRAKTRTRKIKHHPVRDADSPFSILRTLSHKNNQK
ncbi:helicase-related protein [Acetobacteraceae bacterium ESL0709]|nr:helicase-related protein [Acetobacteraceae bacterium ESL0697]MDF7677833.1 helicase-related protein [Acetobacteraceae bacterium ESL0709]